MFFELSQVYLFIQQPTVLSMLTMALVKVRERSCFWLNVNKIVTDLDLSNDLLMQISKHHF